MCHPEGYGHKIHGFQKKCALFLVRYHAAVFQGYEDSSQGSVIGLLSLFIVASNDPIRMSSNWVLHVSNVFEGRILSPFGILAGRF